ncbi:MAG: ATP-binding protein [Candidatus Schekmanbacteria bacterium]|nr:ATP-binding protein [Candidatus Schekmanbacteria bacterium]
MKLLTVPGILENLGAIRQFVNQTGREAGLSGQALYDLVLAVDELAANTVLYGYEQNRQPGNIVVTAKTSKTEFTVTLEDTAPAFDPGKHNLPQDADLIQPMEERNIGGLGIYLAVKGVDGFKYQRIDQKNIVKLSKKLPPGS